MTDALCQGLNEGGVSTVEVGLVTSPMMWYVVGKRGLAGGVMVTASHNPAGDNGFKIVDTDCHHGDGTQDKILTEYGPIERNVLPPTTPIGKWLYLSSMPDEPIDILSDWANVFADGAPYFNHTTVADFDLDGRADIVGANGSSLFIGTWNDDTLDFDTKTTNIGWTLGRRDRSRRRSCG